MRAAALLGSCNVATVWEKAITTVERDLARLDYDLPSLFYATDTLRYLPNSELQRDETVDAWLGMIGDQPPWPNPGRLGQCEACLRWSLDLARTDAWASIRAPCLVLAFEHDIDSPPAHAQAAAAQIPGARFAVIDDTSHLAPFTHAELVGDGRPRLLRRGLIPDRSRRGRERRLRWSDGVEVLFGETLQHAGEEGTAEWQDAASLR